MLALALAAALLAPGQGWAQRVALPKNPDSIKFAVIGDSGSGSSRQYELATVLARAHEQFPFEFAIMLGDNIYGRERPRDFERKFERPYKALLDRGVDFYASLGNHDEPNQRFYEHFNMGGKRHYVVKKGPVHFFVVDTTYMDKAQLDWLDRELGASDARWKIVYGHHPMYSSGARHGSELDLRALVEPILLKHGVDLVFAGHEHFYERLNPQRGIHYITSGAAGKLRRGNIRRGPMTAAGFDQDLSFALVEIDGDQLHLQAISRTGETVDTATINRPPDPPELTTGGGR